MISNNKKCFDTRWIGVEIYLLTQMLQSCLCIWIRCHGSSCSMGAATHGATGNKQHTGVQSAVAFGGTRVKLCVLSVREQFVIQPGSATGQRQTSHSVSVNALLYSSVMQNTLTHTWKRKRHAGQRPLTATTPLPLPTPRHRVPVWNTSEVTVNTIVPHCMHAKSYRRTQSK